MATTPRRTPAHQMFVKLLFGYHVLSGEYQPDEIAEVAGRVHELYPDYRGGKATGLSANNIYKILRGQHRKLPTLDQLNVLVLALQHLAYRGHVRDRDPGCGTLAGWQALLSQAKALDHSQRARKLYIRGDEYDVAQPLRLPGSPAPSPAVPALAPAMPIPTTPIKVTEDEMHELTALGHYARSLAMESADANHRAFYELAVILGTASSPHNRRAAQFAIAAAVAAPGPSPASDLLDADAALDAGRAASHARVLAYAAAGRGDHAAVRVFERCADRVESPDLRTRPPRLRD
ncbi:hypothetical protein [Actinomadura sp. 7K534]|uniref:hypothetical protein n=1 Tax=Actinomadura sp. 7K534 TaxID=2530366 RepID=UPI001048B6B3|nr:hypothetical protein [Actinomadura sp. 7K534]TDB99305.1 hypothetical protein E1266_00500 [Actinomadura sp. 7K534]